MSVPDWWEAALLALAAWRVFQLLALDDILDSPRRYVTRLGSEWRKEGDPVPISYRVKWGKFLTCAYCMGAWVAVAFWSAWEIWPHATLVFSTPFALSAAVIAASKVFSSE